MSKRLLALLSVAFAAAGCSHAGSSGFLPGSAIFPATPKSISPALIKAAPMVQLPVLPPSAMQSPAIAPHIAVSTLGWSQVPGTASAVAASPDGSLWALSDQPSSSSDKFIWHYANGSWTNISGMASQLSAASDGSLWALNSGGGIWHYANGSWTTPGGGASNSVSADTSGGVYVLSNGGAGPDRAIWHYTNGTWIQPGGSGIALAAGSDTSTFVLGPGHTNGITPGGVYIINSAGGIWYVNPDSSFAQLPGSATALAPTGNGGLFVLGYPNNPAGNQVYYYDLNSPGFTAEPGTGVTSISANNTNLYLISSSGAIYSSSLPSVGTADSVNITSNGSAWVAITRGVPASIPLTVVEKDANGKTLTGTYSKPVTLTNNDTTGSLSLNTTNVTSSSTTVTLTYNGSAAITGTYIRGTASGAPYASNMLVVGPCSLSAGVGRNGYYPCDLQSAYNLIAASATNGSGQTVGIVDAWDDPNAESDLAVYRATFGLPPCTTANGCFKKRAEDGSTNYPLPDANWGNEISLDLDMVSAICPNCKILLVEATIGNSNGVDFFLTENEAVALGATQISNSWGGGEGVNSLNFEQYMNHPGIAIAVSSGDNGYGVSYPASSQYVTAVGGTTLTAAANARGWTETAWSGGGSGCSTVIAKPAWQTDPACAKRMVSDVSAVADGNTPVWVYDTYKAPGWERLGGTSASSPIVAAVYALAGNAVTSASALYSNAGSLFDVTSGSNGTCTFTYFCNAQAGYDGPTGLGTPNGVTSAFIKAHAVEREIPIYTPLNYHPGPAVRVCPALPGQITCFAVRRTDD